MRNNRYSGILDTQVAITAVTVKICSKRAEKEREEFGAQMLENTKV